VPWVLRATHNILEAASRHSDIRRVVMTSSAVAALFAEPNKEGIVVREGERPIPREGKRRMRWLTLHLDSWNDEAIKQAYNPDAPEHMKGMFGYAASKTEGEKAAWKWVEKNKPGFQFNTVLPDFTVSFIVRWPAIQNIRY
jgi:hypothetical protein